MDKSKVLKVMLQFLFLVVFNVMFFSIGGSEHNLSVWISYFFIHLAYLILILTPILVQGRDNRSTMLRATFTISLVYFLVELIVGVVLIFVAAEKHLPTFLIQFALLAIFASVLIINLIADQDTAEAEVIHKAEVDFKKNALTKVGIILSSLTQTETKKLVERAYDLLEASPLKSHESVSPLETQIIDQISRLTAAVDSGDDGVIQAQAQQLSLLVTQRNMQLRRMH